MEQRTAERLAEPEEACGIGPNSTINLEEFTIYCETSGINFDVLKLLIYTGADDNGSVNELVKLSPTKWILDGNIRWPSGVDFVRMSVVHEVQLVGDVALGSISMTRAELEKNLQENKSNGLDISKPSSETPMGKVLTFEMKNEKGDRDFLIINFSVVLVEEQEVDNHIDLNELRDAVLAIPDDPRKAMYLNYQGDEHMKSFRVSKNKDYIDAAITFYRVASECLPSDDARHSAFKHDIYLGLIDRYEAFGQIEDLDECISVLQAIIDSSTGDDPEKYIWVMNLGSSFLRRFERLGDIKDLKTAIANQEYSISMLSPDNPNKAGSLVNLGSSYVRLFERQGNPNDLERSISALDEGLSLSPDEIKVLPPLLSTLGLCLMRRFEFKQSPEDIDRAIRVQRRAVALLPSGHEDVPRWLNNMANSLLSRFEQLKDVDDLEESITVQRKVMQLTSPDHQAFNKQLSNLGTALMTRFHLAGSIPDMEESIMLHREAIGVDDEVVGKWEWMQNLSNALFSRFITLGNLHDIEEAISIQQKVIALHGENTLALSIVYGQLGMSLYRRFLRTMDLGDIDAAIKAVRDGINMSPKGHPDIHMLWNYLSVCLAARFERTDNLQDIEEAVVSQRMVVDNTDENSTYFPQLLNNFTVCLLSKFERYGDMNDLNEAIRCGNKSVELTDIADAVLPQRLFNLGRSHRYHFEKSREIAMLERSIKLYKRVVELTPDGHADLTQSLGDLGDALYLLFEAKKDAVHLHEALTLYRKSTTLQTGSPMVRINSGRMWALVSKANGLLLEAFDAYLVCFNILPQLISLGQTITNRHTQLKPISTLATEAAAVAIALGKYSTAVEWLEQGRGIVWNQLNNLRSSVDELRKAHPSLAESLVSVSEKLQHAGSRAQAQIPFMRINQRILLQDEVIEHQKMAQEWESLVDRTRQLSGFENFLKPLQFEEIIGKLPTEGPVVVVNVDHLRSDAIALYHNNYEVILIPLDRFDHDIGEGLRKVLEGILKSHGLLVRDVRAGKLVRNNQKSEGFETILMKLWNFVAKPIFDRLNITKATEKPPRLWWCTTGSLSFLPIHAAGLYRQAAMSTDQRVPDLVISSYTPTLSALFEKVTGLKEKYSFQGLLTISQPNTPNLPQIPKTEIETEIAVELFKAAKLKNQKISGEAATYETVLREMRSYSWIHFACHALQHNEDPTKSAIYLHDGQLSISDIIQRQIPYADFAFLSACQTATGDRQLSEEAVHLAAGMLTAGYKSVIASMWSISDEYAPMVSNEVYSYMLQNRANKGSPDSSLSGAALYSAIGKIRREPKLINTEDTSFLAWVPFIHIGF